jgi:hypothetical protein
LMTLGDSLKSGELQKRWEWFLLPVGRLHYVETGAKIRSGFGADHHYREFRELINTVT